MTTGKTTALTRRTFVGKVTFLLFNILSFLPRSKRLLISWLQSPSAVILEPPKIKPVTVSIVSPSICHEVMGLDAMILVFCMLSFKPTFSLASFTFMKRLFSSSLSAPGRGDLQTRTSGQLRGPHWGCQPSRLRWRVASWWSDWRKYCGWNFTWGRIPLNQPQYQSLSNNLFLPSLLSCIDLYLH